MIRHVYNDGGRKLAGFTGKAPGDCVVRSIAIATEKPYREVYDAINARAKKERPRSRGRSSSRAGVWRQTFEAYLVELGWVWTPTMGIGTGCTVHLTPEELPPGRLLVAVSRHLTCVIDGLIHDTHDPSRGGTRCVYGYYRKAGAT